MNHSLKSFLSPFVAAAFTVMAVTGVLLSFEIETRAISVLHDWFGWAFVGAGIVHLIVNGRPLVAYLRQRAGVLSLTGALVGVLGLAWLSRYEPRHGDQERRDAHVRVESSDD